MDFGRWLHTRHEIERFTFYGFAKNERENIGSDEEAELEAYGAILMSLSDDQISEMIDQAKVRELKVVDSS